MMRIKTINCYLSNHHDSLVLNYNDFFITQCHIKLYKPIGNFK